MIQDEEEATVLVEESFPSGDHREEIISKMTEDELQITTPPVSTQQVPSFIKNLQGSTLNYDKFQIKRPVLL